MSADDDGALFFGGWDEVLIAMPTDHLLVWFDRVSGPIDPASFDVEPFINLGLGIYASQKKESHFAMTVKEEKVLPKQLSMTTK